MLSGRGLSDELMTRPEESYRLRCFVVCDLETSRIGAPYIYEISSLRVNPCITWTLIQFCNPASTYGSLPHSWQISRNKRGFFDHTVRLTDMSPNLVSSVSLHNRLLQSYHLSLYAVYQKERIMVFIPFVFKELMSFAGNIGLRENSEKNTF